MFKRLQNLVLAIALAFSFLALTSHSALAAATVSFDPESSLINASTIYETANAGDRTQILNNVLISAEETLPQSKGFVNATILKGQDGAQLVVLSQWQDLASYKAYETKRKANPIEKKVADSLKVRSYSYNNIRHIETRKGLPTLHERDRNVMFSEYFLRDPAKQSELLMVTEQFMPSVMSIKPGLQWVALFPSTDKTTTAFVAQFDKPDDFKTLSQDAGFKDYAYWDAYADNEHHLYDVVKIIS